MRTRRAYGEEEDGGREAGAGGVPGLGGVKASFPDT